MKKGAANLAGWRRLLRWHDSFEGSQLMIAGKSVVRQPKADPVAIAAEARAHDPLVCGLDADLCPGCRAEPKDDLQGTPGLVEQVAAEQLARTVGLIQPPPPLERDEQRALLRQLMAVLRTCRQRPAYGRALRGLITLIMEDSHLC